MDLKKITVMASMSALSVVLALLIRVPFVPPVQFLEYSPADIPVLISGFLFGPAAGLLVTVVVALVQGLTVSASSGLYGIIMHIIATGSLVLTSSLIYRAHKDRRGAAAALAAGSLVMTAVMGGANLVVTPYFTGWPVSGVVEVLPYILLFNFLKAAVNCVLTALIYKRISKLVHRWEGK